MLSAFETTSVNFRNGPSSQAAISLSASRIAHGREHAAQAISVEDASDLRVIGTMELARQVAIREGAGVERNICPWQFRQSLRDAVGGLNAVPAHIGRKTRWCEANGHVDLSVDERSGVPVAPFRPNRPSTWIPVVVSDHVADIAV